MGEPLTFIGEPSTDILSDGTPISTQIEIRKNVGAVDKPAGESIVTAQIFWK